MCINTPGSYECQCRDDYVGNGFNCEIRRCDHGTFGKGEFDDCEGQESKIVHAICRCSNSYKLHCRALVDLRFDSKKIRRSKRSNFGKKFIPYFLGH